MADTRQTHIEQRGREVIFSREFDAPRELVFSMFSEPGRLSQWWGPTTWPVKVCHMDFRPGGTWHYCMEGPDGQQAWGKAIYEEIDEPARIVLRDFFSDAEGNKAGELPESVTTVTFEEEGGQTRLVSRSVYPTEDDVKTVVGMGMLEGVQDTWDQLDRLLHQP